MKKIIIFIGPPGSGKGTQAKKITQKYNYGHISTGDLLRKLQTQLNIETDEKKALEAMKAGQLVPDWLIYRLAFKEAEWYVNQGRGIVLDGAIRTLPQATMYQEYFKGKGLAHEILAIEVALPDEESFNRLIKRRVCNDCGYIVPPAVTSLQQAIPSSAVCPACGGQLTTRADDSEKVVRQRISVQGNSAIAPVREYYQSLGLLKTLDGTRSIEEVEENIDTILN